MVQLNLPKNSIPVKGNSYSNVDLIDEQSQQNHDIRIVNVYRCNHGNVVFTINDEGRL